MQLTKLFQTEIKDRFSRENFARVEQFFRDDLLRKGRFAFFQYAVEDRGTFPKTLAVPHGLSFRPTDVLLLSILDGTLGDWVDWNYNDFTVNNLDFTVSGPFTLRALVGRYGES